MLGLMTIGALDVIMIVWPSGGDFTTSSAPMLPPAPPRLSMMKGLPSSSCRPFAIGRAAVSEGPPGGHGTITFTDYDGQPCAEASENSAESRKAGMNAAA